MYTDGDSVPGIMFKFLDIDDITFEKSRIFFESFVGAVVLKVFIIGSFLDFFGRIEDRSDIKFLRHVIGLFPESSGSLLFEKREQRHN